MNGEINSLEYANERMNEIQEIEREIEKRKKNKMLFQLVPFHKRRRMASFDERRLPKEHRRAERNKRRRAKTKYRQKPSTLQTHVWHAKRFFMLKSVNIFLPHQRHSKSDSFIGKAIETRGVLNDISYWKVFIKKDRLSNRHKEDNNDSKTIANKSKNTIVNKSKDNNDVSIDLEVIKKGNNDCLEKEYKLYNRTEKEIEEILIVEERNVNEYTEIANLCVLEVLGTQKKVPLENTNETSISISEMSTSTEYKYIYRSNGSNSIILCNRASVMRVWQKCIVSGIVPGGIMDLFRIGLEKGKVPYPFGLPSTNRGIDLITQTKQKHVAEIDRKPVGKRPNIVEPLFEGDHCNCVPVLFTADKGSFSLHSPVIISDALGAEFEMTGTEKVVGEVGHSGFSFSLGKTAGIIYMLKGYSLLPGERVFIRSLTQSVFRAVTHKDMTSDDIL
ncbi:hypothetical protein NEOKW01_1201 [Nematocida sp. AWRm80]|nr:hypothetical protein NEOKW01_1201 [Nematocida sp. AWRm80]